MGGGGGGGESVSLSAGSTAREIGSLVAVAVAVFAPSFFFSLFIFYDLYFIFFATDGREELAPSLDRDEEDIWVAAVVGVSSKQARKRASKLSTSRQ